MNENITLYHFDTGYRLFFTKAFLYETTENGILYCADERFFGCSLQ